MAELLWGLSLTASVIFILFSDCVVVGTDSDHVLYVPLGANIFYAKRIPTNANKLRVKLSSLIEKQEGVGT